MWRFLCIAFALFVAVVVGLTIQAEVRSFQNSLDTAFQAKS